MDKLLVRPSEAAEMLGLGRSKVYAMLASGELPSVRIGKSVRVPTEALRQWVQERVSASNTSAHPGEQAAVAPTTRTTSGTRHSRREHAIRS